MKLSGWQRWGILLSILWAIGGAIHQRTEDVEKADDFAKFSYKVCADNKVAESDTDLRSCTEGQEKNRKIWMEGSTGNVAVFALMPIPLAWFAVFILRYIVRAQAVGFRAVVPWQTLSKPKKSFVVFSTVATVAVALFGIMVAMNLYVDTLVPVSIGYKSMVMKTGNSYVTAEGTWTRSGLTAGSSIAVPLQTSKINCNREERRCLEAKASVSGNVLTSELVQYDIESWSDTAIVFKNEDLCYAEVFTIDLRTSVVNGAGKQTNMDDAYCKRFSGREAKWNYRLADGFSVYWDQRQKARPLPLRVMHAFFGN
jgi:hypothetical protein